VLECSVEVLYERLLQRRRDDDDAETIQKRIQTYVVTTAVVLEQYTAAAKVVRIDADAEVEVVATEILKALTGHKVVLQAREL
jgi:UMP-CMP kinase